jgi:hypothetical protein
MLPAERPRRKRRMIASSSTMSSGQLWIHRCLCLLFFTLIFEGLARKLAPPAAEVLIFFFKDFVTVLLLLLSLISKQNAQTRRLLRMMGLLLTLFLPCLALTAYHDFILAIFGMKEYLLYPAVGVAMCAAYLPNHHRQFLWLFKLATFSVVVTTLVAVVQNRLPADHWLNLGVVGEDLSMFTSAGYMRVSSTFPFVAQYCMYLNAMCYCLPTFFYLNTAFRGRTSIVQFIVISLQVVFLIGLFLVAIFVTGSRTSVIGNSAILGVGGMLAAVCCGVNAFTRVVVPVMVGIALLGLLSAQFPQFFEAYQARIVGTSEASHNVEVEKRLESGLLDWTGGSTEAPPSLFGYGLGVMSNGSDKLSAYAARWRSSGFWTETDQASTFFEGGWYLIFVWYGFRFWIILHTLATVLKIRFLEFRFVACFAWGFVFIIGIMGTLGIQPPLAIWWWLAVGLITCLGHFDRERPKEMTQVKPDSQPVPNREAEHPFIVNA